MMYDNKELIQMNGKEGQAFYIMNNKINHDYADG